MLFTRSPKTFITTIKAGFQHWAASLMTPVDASSIAVFRILFGAIMIWEVTRYFEYDRIGRYYIEPTFFFPYEFFPFISPLPGTLMYWVFFAMGIFALGVTVGFFYRASAILFCLTYTYVFLIDKTDYNNHYYLIILVSFLLILVDADRWAALDRWHNPKLSIEQVPFWNVFILRAQIFVVYFFGGVAKLNPDWLVGQPIGAWLNNRAHYPVLGPFFASEWAGLIFGYGGLLFDLSIGFLLIWRPTRFLAFLLILYFNLMNAWLFSIGIFPYMMIATTILFVEPDWPRHILRLPWRAMPKFEPRRVIPYRPWVVGFVTVYMALQILIPLRHFLYPGEVSWTEEGHRFSWHMKLRSKSGRAAFTMIDPRTDQIWPVDISQDLTDRQSEKMAGRPDMILQYVRYLETKFIQAGVEEPIIKVEAWASLNGRPYQYLIYPTIDLTKVEADPLFYHTAWIVPLQTELEDNLVRSEPEE